MTAGTAVNSPVCNAPGQCYLRASLAVFLANLFEHWLVHELAHVLAAGIDLVLVAEG